MKKDTRNIILIGAALFAIYVIMNINRQPGPMTAPPPYPQGSPQWIEWAQRIVTTAGGLVDTLFGPGGPFEGKKKSDVQKALNTATNQDAYYFYN